MHEQSAVKPPVPVLTCAFLTAGLLADFSEIHPSQLRQPTPYLEAGYPSPGADAFTYDSTNGLRSAGDIHRVKN